MMVGAYHEPLAMPPARVEYLAKQYQAEVQQRLRRARWISDQRLSAPEALHIPLSFDPHAPL
jgi:hypothetical protein